MAACWLCAWLSNRTRWKATDKSAHSGRMQIPHFRILFLLRPRRLRQPVFQLSVPCHDDQQSYKQVRRVLKPIVCRVARHARCYHLSRIGVDPVKEDGSPNAAAAMIVQLRKYDGHADNADQEARERHVQFVLRCARYVENRGKCQNAQPIPTTTPASCGDQRR